MCPEVPWCTVDHDGDDGVFAYHRGAVIELINDAGLITVNAVTCSALGFGVGRPGVWVGDLGALPVPDARILAAAILCASDLADPPPGQQHVADGVPLPVPAVDRGEPRAVLLRQHGSDQATLARWADHRHLRVTTITESWSAAVRLVADHRADSVIIDRLPAWLEVVGDVPGGRRRPGRIRR